MVMFPSIDSMSPLKILQKVIPSGESNADATAKVAKNPVTSDNKKICQAFISCVSPPLRCCHRCDFDKYGIDGLNRSWLPRNEDIAKSSWTRAFLGSKFLHFCQCRGSDDKSQRWFFLIPYLQRTHKLSAIFMHQIIVKFIPPPRARLGLCLYAHPLHHALEGFQTFYIMRMRPTRTLGCRRLARHHYTLF